MMEQGSTEKSIYERHFRYKIPLPEALKEPPSLKMGLELYYSGFNRLNSCRENGFGIGQINYFMCVQYCEKNDICGDQREDFIDVILAVDEKFVEYCKKKQPSKGTPDG